MALIRAEQFYAAKLTQPLDLGGSETTVYVSTLPTETTGSLVINPRSSTKREKITYTGVASSPNRLTGVTRGIAFATTTGTATSTARVAANCYRHAVGESIEMVPGHYESLMSDILNGIGTMVNDINMGGFQFTNVGTPTLNGHVATKAYADAISTGGGPDANTTTKGFVEEATQAEIAAGTGTGGTSARLAVNPSTLAPHVQSNAWLYFTEDGTGADDTYTATLTPSLTAYTTGMVLFGKITVANTGACTININSLGAKDIQKYVAGALGALETGDIIANQVVALMYDGTRFVMLNPGGSLPTTALLTEAAAFFAATDITGSEAEDLTDGGSTSLHSHGAAVITVPSDYANIGTSAGIAYGTTAEAGNYMSYADGVEDYASFACTVPSGSTTISSIHVIYVPEATGNLYLKFRAAKAMGAAGGAFVIDTTDALATYATTSASTTHALVTVPAGAYNAITSVAAGDIVTVDVVRDASNAADTYGATWKVMGVKFTFA